MASIQVTVALVALDKEKNPQKYCPTRKCLWRTKDGSYCPRHKPTNDTISGKDKR